MESEKTLQIEHKLNKIAAYAPYVHCAGFTLLLVLGYLKPRHHSEILKTLTISFLIITFIVNKFYIYTGKKVENQKKFSEEEIKKRTKEYYMKFFAPIFFWTICVLVVSN